MARLLVPGPTSAHLARRLRTPVQLQSSSKRHSLWQLGSRIMVDDSGFSPKSVSIKRNPRSASSGIAGHVRPEIAVTMARNTCLADTHIFKHWLHDQSDNYLDARRRPTTSQMPPVRRPRLRLRALRHCGEWKYWATLIPAPNLSLVLLARRWL